MESWDGGSDENKKAAERPGADAAAPAPVAGGFDA